MKIDNYKVIKGSELGHYGIAATIIDRYGGVIAECPSETHARLICLMLNAFSVRW